jgi:hypothetical protein
MKRIWTACSFLTLLLLIAPSALADVTRDVAAVLRAK